MSVIRTVLRSMIRAVTWSHLRSMTWLVARTVIRSMIRTVSRPVAWFDIWLARLVVMLAVRLYIWFIGRLVTFIVRLAFGLYCLRRILSFRRSLSCYSTA